MNQQDDDFRKLHVPVQPNTTPDSFAPPLRFHYTNEDGQKTIYENSRPFWVRLETQIVKVPIGKKWKSHQGTVKAEKSEVLRFLSYVAAREAEMANVSAGYVSVSVERVFRNLFAPPSVTEVQIHVCDSSEDDDVDEENIDILDELLLLPQTPETLKVIASIREERRKEMMERVSR
ncbi:hypothetical protein HDU86_005398 [Geranomyces michiganensis]|nr:hypothetical protein HDU86_005398 [Geranomyces michiganensis]